MVGETWPETGGKGDRGQNEEKEKGVVAFVVRFRDIDVFPLAKVIQKARQHGKDISTIVGLLAQYCKW